MMRRALRSSRGTRPGVPVGPMALVVAMALSGQVMISATPVTAKVIEIGDAGDVIVHDRPEVYLTPGARGQAIAPGTGMLGAPQRSFGLRPSRDSSNIRASLASEARRNGLSPDLVEAVAWRESHFNPSALSSKGAMGVMQLMPATARGLGVDPLDASSNIRGGTALLAQLLRRYDGDVVKALAAYNASPNAVDRHGGPPPYKETQAYVAAILERMASNATNPTSLASGRTH